VAARGTRAATGTAGDCVSEQQDGGIRCLAALGPLAITEARRLGEVELTFNPSLGGLTVRGVIPVEGLKMLSTNGRANTDPAKPVALLAIEPADIPWPPLPGKTASAGPFYIVWTGASAATIRSEQWPYQVARLASQPSPAARWPALGVDPALPATHPVRAGQALFVTQCSCHTLNGAGASTVGPDLNQPMNPTEYLTPAGLHALIRDPKSVRHWPKQQMPGFPGGPDERPRNRPRDRVSRTHDNTAHIAITP
jgi:mono/diheme cytochrome c family protein